MNQQLQISIEKIAMMYFRVCYERDALIEQIETLKAQIQALEKKEQ